MSTDQIKHQKTVADKFLKALERLNPSVIVAGGAPRDWSEGKPAKDIDVFIHYNLVGTAIAVVSNFIQQELPEVEFISVKTDERIPEHYKRNPSLKGVLTYMCEDVEVQVMVLSEPTYDLMRKHFPVSSSMYWYKHGRLDSGSGETYLFEEYKIQLVHPEYFKELNSNPYMLKIRERYPESDGYVYLNRDTYRDLTNQLGIYSGCKLHGLLKGLREATNEALKGYKAV